MNIQANYLVDLIPSLCYSIIKFFNFLLSSYCYPCVWIYPPGIDVNRFFFGCFGWYFYFLY